MALKSATSRRKAREATETAQAAETELAALTSCPCGCVPGEECITDRPPPAGTHDAHCCGGYGLDTLANGHALREHGAGHLDEAS